MARHKRSGRARPAAGAALALLLVALTAAPACAPPPLSPRVTIVVRCAPFASAEAASRSDSLVDWDDADHADDDACTESYAALELRDFLKRCPGVGARDIAILPGVTLPPRGDVIVLGNRATQPLVAALLGRAAPERVSPQAFRLRALRRDGRNVWCVAGGSRVGTLYGTYALLERLGVRFYGPADSETVLPRDAVELPRRLDVATAPAYDVRGFWAWEPRGDRAFLRWMARRRMNLWTAAEHDVPFLRELGIRLAAGGHSMESDLLDPHARLADGRTRFQEHPEWYGLHGGRRSDRLAGESGDNFCTSNPRAMAEFTRNLVASLSAGPLRDADLVNVWPLDGGRWCECDACRALGTPTDRALDLALHARAAIADARQLSQLHRRVVVSAAAYLDMVAPPTRPVDVPPRAADFEVTFFPYYRCYAHALTDPACTEFNRRLAAAWAGWSGAPQRAYVGPLGVGEYYDVSWFKALPLVYPHVMARDIADYHAGGARLFHYMHAPTARWGPWRLDHLVLSEALWNPRADVDSLVADYAARAFPSSPADARAYLRALETASANIFAVEVSIGGVFAVAGHPEGRLAVRAMPLLPYAHLPLEPAERATNRAPQWTEILAALHDARAALDRARAAARTPAERTRLDDDDARLTYGELTFGLWDRVLRLSRADHGEPGVDVTRALREADSLATRLHGITDLVHVAGEHGNAADGLDASHVAPTLAWFHQRFAARASRR